MSSLYYCGIAFVSQFQLFSNDIKNILIPLVWIFGIIMCRLYAPADTENVPILRKKERKIKQILSYIIMTITLSLGVVIKNNTISNLLIIGTLLQTITITKVMYKLTKNKYGYLEYIKMEKVEGTN